MNDFERLVLDYDEFEFMYDTYGYGDAFSDREEAREVTRNALMDKDFRKAILDRLQEIVDEDDEYKTKALKLMSRIRELERRSR